MGKKKTKMRRTDQVKSIQKTDVCFGKYEEINSSLLKKIDNKKNSNKLNEHCKGNKKRTSLGGGGGGGGGEGGQ